MSRWLESTAGTLWAFSTPLLTKIAARKGFAVKAHGYQWNVPVRYPVKQNATLNGVPDPYTPSSRPTEQGGWTVASFVPAQFEMKFADAFYDIRAGGDQTQRVDRLRTLFDQCMDNVTNKILTDLFAAEGATGADGQSRDHLGSIFAYVNGGGGSTTNDGFTKIRKDPPSDIGGTYTALGTSPLTKIGNIERNQVGGAFWSSNIYYPGSSATLSSQLLFRMINESSYGKRKPDVVYAGPKIYSYLQTVLAGQQRSGLEKYGFTAMSWIGVDIALDQNITEATNANQILGIDTSSFALYMDTMQPQFTPMRDVDNVALQYYVALMHGQLVTKDPGICNFRHGKLSDPS